MVRISNRVIKKLLILSLDFLISAVALALTSTLRSKIKWKLIKSVRLNTGKNARSKVDGYTSGEVSLLQGPSKNS